MAHLSERHLTEQASRIIKKNLIPQGLTDQRTCEMDRTNEPVPEDLTRQTTSEFIRTHDPPAPPPSMQTIYELDSSLRIMLIVYLKWNNRKTEMTAVIKLRSSFGDSLPFNGPFWTVFLQAEFSARSEFIFVQRAVTGEWALIDKRKFPSEREILPNGKRS